MSELDPWAILDRASVMAYLDSYPDTAQVELFGDATTGKQMFVDGITRSGSTMDIGMFG